MLIWYLHINYLICILIDRVERSLTLPKWLACLLLSGTGVSYRFFHTTFQFACGHNVVMRISRVHDASLSILCIVAYIRLLYALCDSVRSCGAVYPHPVEEER